MLDYSETSENVYLAFNQHIGLTNKKIENLVHLTFKAKPIELTLGKDKNSQSVDFLWETEFSVSPETESSH